MEIDELKNNLIKRCFLSHGKIGKLTVFLLSQIFIDGISKSQIEYLLNEIEGECWQLYSDGKFEDGLSLFCYLASIDPSRANILYGIAACKHCLKDYISAKFSYMGVTLLNSTNLETKLNALFYLSDCCIHLNDLNMAKKYLYYLIQLGLEEAEFQDIVAKARKLLKKIMKIEIDQYVESKQ